MTEDAEPASTVRHDEIELKFLVTDQATRERLIAAHSFGAMAVAVGRLRTVQIEDVYVDTADGAIGRHGYAARLRQNGPDTIVSVKSLARTDAAG
ncbi:MAG: CYTH domain-containing protein, partial [Candidatus Limnocylindrales bacterium]